MFGGGSGGGGGGGGEGGGELAPRTTKSFYSSKLCRYYTGCPKTIAFCLLFNSF